MITRESFKKFYEDAVKHAHTLFEKDGTHTHISLLLLEDDVKIIPFSVLEDQAHDLIKSKFDKEPGQDMVKDIVFKYVAEMATVHNALAYVDIGECWMLAKAMDDTSETTLEVAQKMWPPSANPMRLEGVYLSAIFGNLRIIRMWKIVRRGKAVWLEPFQDEEYEIKSEDELKGYKAGTAELVVYRNGLKARLFAPKPKEGESASDGRSADTNP